MFSNRALKKLIIPLFLDQILIITVSIIGTMMVSYAGEAAVSGVSLIDMINMLLINVLAALATGGAVVVSQYIGRKEKEQACFAASQLITVTTVISTGIMLAVLLFNKPLLYTLFGRVDKDVMTAAITYFVISGLSYPFLAVYNSCAALFRSMGNSRIPMTISIVMNVTNVALNAIGIFVFHTGVVGIALAALIARGIAAVIMMYLSLNKNNEIFIRFSEIFSWQGSMIKRILNIAIPNGLENGIVQLGRVLLVSIIALFGTTQIAANGITNSLVGIAISFATAMNLAIVTVVGQCVGAGDYEQASYYNERLTKVSYIGTLIISLAQITLLPMLLSLYTLSPEVRHLTYILVVIHNCFAIFLWPLAFTLPNGLRASGDVRFTMIVSIGSMFILRIALGYILGIAFKMGVIGIWVAMGFDWMLRSIIYIVRFKSGKWKEFKVI
ncbi:MATE family multidrug exporter [Clostridium folliculivorans]|uniref:Probable multidrug resistance protein NorM n=1 Tax=Clostridium folliculivorans TaxID=2886038 RepID=A0A9W5Y0I0_9CLOT|nr:MATE family efflux transporter [Clostridium folliculivorans]GKU24274.1 MATE family multidrug exporter [Clostridium folliculivorans]